MELQVVVGGAPNPIFLCLKCLHPQMEASQLDGSSQHSEEATSAAAATVAWQYQNDQRAVH